VRPEYAKVRFKPIHWQIDNGDLSPDSEYKAKRRYRSLFGLKLISGASMPIRHSGILVVHQLL
jgi:hypothetical protein